MELKIIKALLELLVQATFDGVQVTGARQIAGIVGAAESYVAEAEKESNEAEEKDNE